MPQSGKNISGVSPHWRHFDGLQPYAPLVQSMQAHAAAIRAEGAAEEVWLLQHEAVFTGGTSARDADLLVPGDIPAVRNGRGGQWTYHGPGQRIIWPVLDLTKRAQDVRLYVYQLEGWMIDVLASFGIEGLRREGLPGIWVQRRDIGLSDRLDKIVAIGVRISRWVTSHGMAFNLDPELSHYDGIVPCGVTDGGVTSFADLGLIISQAELDMAIQDCFAAHFGPDSPLAIRS